MLIRLKQAKILKIAVYLFIATTAIFLSASFTLAAPDVGLDKVGDIGLSNAVDLRIIIARIIRIFIGLLGILAVGLIIYAGFLWMTSAGDEQKIEQAKNILKNAVIGLIIILSAFAIASFILNLLVGATSGGQNGPGDGPPSRYGLSALGNGIIQSHYPARDQKEVPRNTSIIITFREPMKADTLCLPLGATACNNSDINKNIIRIFKQDEEAVCVAGATPSSQCTSLTEAKVYSTDGKTFVFVPINYLGSPSEYINYTVYLGNGLLRQSGEKAFPGISGDYGWSFEISNKIDLDPPIVKNNGVFPLPDNVKDTTVPGVGNQAEGTITVNSPRVYRAAAASVSTANSAWSATVTVDESCSQSGTFTVNTDSNPSIVRLKDISNRLLGQGTINGKTVAFSLCNLKLTLDSGSFAINSLWTVTIAPMIAADTITVGNITYTASNVEDIPKFNFEAISADTRDIAESIRNVLRNNPEAVASRGATRSIVKITAKLAGAAGNSINLSSSNAARLPVVAMAGGLDKVDNVTVNSMKDQPMNTAIQINFNEAIMPLTVSGTTDEVKDFIKVVNANPAAKPTAAAPGDKSCAVDADCKSFVCDNGTCTGVNEYLKGKFAISNQYQTVEFLSDKECGFNTCGEKIYCLPANSHLKVELMAASLISCEKDRAADNGLCVDKSPFNTCDLTRKFCRDNVDANKYFPQADKTKATIVDGIVDAAFNSLDGNRNDSAYGPIPNVYYNENTKAATDSDNYKWSFFISNILDLTPPKIKTTTPIINGVNVPLVDKLTLNFDKVMLSSRLTTGSLMIQNGKQNIQHYLLNLRSLADQPVGYWVTNEGRLNNSGEIISTNAFINHSSFNPSATYKAQAGSGLKDIYQNCFLPCSSENLTGIPSCCDGVPQDKASCP